MTALDHWTIELEISPESLFFGNRRGGGIPHNSALALYTTYKFVLSFMEEMLEAFAGTTFLEILMEISGGIVVRLFVVIFKEIFEQIFGELS